MDVQIIHTMSMMKAYAYLLQHRLDSRFNWEHPFCHCLIPNRWLKIKLLDGHFLFFGLIGSSVKSLPPPEHSSPSPQFLRFLYL